MGGDVLLFHPRTLHEKNYRYFYIPYSVLSLVTPLRAAGFGVKVVDNNLLRSSDHVAELQSLSETCICVGVSVMIGRQIADAIAISEAAKSILPTAPVVWGGPCPTMIPEAVEPLECVDAVVRGQGEATLTRWLASIQSTRSGAPDARAGRSKTGAKLVLGEAGRLADINLFPGYADAYDEIDVAAYVRPDEHIGSRTVNYHSSQGCPYSCGFCCETALWGKHWSGFGVGRVINDLRVLIDRHQINGIKFYDSDFFADRPRAVSFAEAVLSEGWSLSWAGSSHPANLLKLSDRDWRALGDSGLSRLLIGAESGSIRERALVGKRITDDQLTGLAHRCADLGIAGSFTFVTGLPGFDLRHIEVTLDFARRLRQTSAKHEAKVHFYAPYPGTRLYPLALEHGFRPPRTIREWAEYDYYDITTPWIPNRFQEEVTEFNRANCPYVACSRFGETADT